MCTRWQSTGRSASTSGSGIWARTSWPMTSTLWMRRRGGGERATTGRGAARQRLVCGLGTMWASEGAYVAGASPFSAAAEVRRLPEALTTIRDRMLHAVDSPRGASRPALRCSNGGPPCRTCGSPIRPAASGSRPYDRPTYGARAASRPFEARTTPPLGHSAMELLRISSPCRDPEAMCPGATPFGRDATMAPVTDDDADPLLRFGQVRRELEARWPESRISPTLQRIRALTGFLGDPQSAYPVILVTGTNGKTPLLA